MISLPFRRSPKVPIIARLYGAIVAQARNHLFYTGYRVPDTVQGRTDMIMLHLVLLLRRLRAAGPNLAPLGQGLFDHFCQDVDDNLREMGVGDLTVPKRMRDVGEAFYGRAKAYDTALDRHDIASLRLVLSRNVFDSPEPPVGAGRLAAYMEATVRHLANFGDRELGEGHLTFPAPETVQEPDPAPLEPSP